MPSTGTGPPASRTFLVPSARRRRGRSRRFAGSQAEPIGRAEGARSTTARLREGRVVERRRLWAFRTAVGFFKTGALAVIVYAALAGLTSLVASREAEGALARALHARRVNVSITAYPFWQLFFGRFATVRATVDGASGGDLAIARLTATWRNGAIDFASLERGGPFRDWATAGRIRVTLWLRPTALMTRLPHGRVMRITAIHLRAPDVDVRGEISVGELRLPFTAVGVPAVAQDGRLLLFRVVRVHAGPIALRSALGIPVVDLTHSPLYPTLHVEAAHVTRRFMVVELAGRGEAHGPGTGRGARGRRVPQKA